jgi:hypothetical protein
MPPDAAGLPPEAHKLVAPTSLDGGGLKFNLKTSEAIQLIGSASLFKRLRFHGWIRPLFKSRDALYPISRLVAVQQRMESGEVPPLLPSEERAQSASRLRRQQPQPRARRENGSYQAPGV